MSQRAFFLQHPRGRARVSTEDPFVRLFVGQAVLPNLWTLSGLLYRRDPSAPPCPGDL